MADDRRRAAPGRGAQGRQSSRGGPARRTEEHPTWLRALNGIGWVVAMAVAVAIVGLALSWLATIVL